MPAPVQVPSRIGFGRFELDVSSRELRRDGHKIPLPHKAFEVLCALVERPGVVVTRDELHARLWAPDTFVEFDDSLNHAVKKLRQVLGDSAEQPQFIETLPRHGYRFLAPTTSLESQGAMPAAKIRWRVRGIFLLLGLAAAAALVALGIRSWRGRGSAQSSESAIRSVAVLPLANLSGDPQQDYFADGMTDALITDVAKIHGLKVISRTSVMQLKDQKKALPEIARMLGVDGIVEGSVQRSGGHMRINVQLVRAPTDTHLWAETYDGDSHDIFKLQSEVARAVAAHIRTVATPGEMSQAASPRRVNPDAYEAYLKGQSHWYHLSREHVDRALGYFELARQIDPEYAPAYDGIASVWLVRGDSGLMAPKEAFPKARAAVSRALELDGSLASAHITLANILGPYDHDWPAAEREFQRGLELNPNSADGHFMYSDFLISMKREQEWEHEIHRALELDPINPFLQCFYGWQLVYVGRADEAIVQLHKVLATEPDFSSAHLGLWGAFYKKRMYEDALQEAKKFFAVLGDHEVEDALTRGYATKSYTEAMHQGALVLAARSRKTHVPAVRVARLYAHAGDKAQVMQWLSKALADRETPLIHLAVAWDWDLVRDDPAFQKLLREAGINAAKNTTGN